MFWINVDFFIVLPCSVEVPVVLSVDVGERVLPVMVCEVLSFEEKTNIILTFLFHIWLSELDGKIKPLRRHLYSIKYCIS